MDGKEIHVELVLLKCPKCGALKVEPSWVLDVQQDISCASCKSSFTKDAEVDRKVLKVLVDEKDRFVGVDFV